MTARRRRHPCDCCGHERARWQRLCAFCWARLPGDIRTGIVESWRRKDRAAWRAWVRRALDHFAGAVARHLAAQAHAAAMIGERDR